MAQGRWFVALVGLVFALASPQAHGQAAKPNHSNAKTVATVTTDHRATDAANQQPKGCPGSQYPRLRCEAIAAQAELEQARQSVRQADQSTRQGGLFRTEILISAVTMFAAIAAAIFAASAATAATGTYKAFVAVERGRLIVAPFDPSLNGTTKAFELEVGATNVGKATCVITRTRLKFAENAHHADASYEHAVDQIMIEQNETKRAGEIKCADITGRPVVHIIIDYKDAISSRTTYATYLINWASLIEANPLYAPGRWFEEIHSPDKPKDT
jgi:hypothetical protein